jgi:thioredoxin-related protein
MNLNKLLGAIVLAITITNIFGTESTIKEIANQQELTLLVNNNPQVVIEFYNPTCPVCNAFKHKGIFPATAKALPSVQFALVSSDAPGLHEKFHIKATPTFVFFKNGHEINRFEGYTDNPVFTHKVESMLSGSK